MGRLSERHLVGLLSARTALAGFVQRSEREARRAGTTHAQHHVLLALGSTPDPDGPMVKDVADALGVASPSAVELISRMVGAGLLDRRTDPHDARRTRLQLTGRGRQLLLQLSQTQLPSLRDLHVRNLQLLGE